MPGRSASGVEPNRTLLLGLLGAAGLALYLIYTLLPKTEVYQSSSTWRQSAMKPMPKLLFDLTSVPITLTSKEVTLTMGKDEMVDIFYRESLPETGSTQPPAVLLLHGAGGSSLKWQDLGTMHLGAYLRHRVVAVDMPGWGQKTKTHQVSDPGAFLAALIEKLDLGKPVIVTSSASGQYSLPFLLGHNPGTCHQRAAGLITIAPTHTDLFTPSQYHRCEIPVLITYGVKDTAIGLNSVGDLRNMPNSEIFPIEKAGHSAHYEFPEEWHTLVYNFLLAVTPK